MTKGFSHFHVKSMYHNSGLFMAFDTLSCANISQVYINPYFTSHAKCHVKTLKVNKFFISLENGHFYSMYEKQAE